MEEHTEEDQLDDARAAPKRRQQRQGPRRVQRPHACALLRLRSTEVAHRGEGIETALVDAIPCEMINIDQNARGPREQCFAA